MNRSLLTRFRFLAALGLAGCGALSAAERTETYRVVGFSHPEREEDFRLALAAVPGVVLVGLDLAAAEVTLRFDPEQLAGGARPGQEVDPEKILEELDKRLGQASVRTFSLTARSTVPEEELATEAIPVGLLDCKGCRYGVYLAVAKLEGVVHASVRSETGLLTVRFDPRKTGRPALEEALKKARVELPAN
jgi:copper chaperone CopZ